MKPENESLLFDRHPKILDRQHLRFGLAVGDGWTGRSSEIFRGSWELLRSFAESSLSDRRSTAILLSIWPWIVRLILDTHGLEGAQDKCSDGVQRLQSVDLV